jgi:hypothetical protein
LKKGIVALAAGLLLFQLTPARAAADDVVLLANGGRVRGTVVSEDPAQGIRIRLADGTIRNIAAKDVKKVEYAGEASTTEVPPPPAPAAPAAPPEAVGSIHVETAAPATVLIDGGIVGKAPADVSAAAAGRHRIHVDFDDGGSRDQIVLVQGGQTAKLMVDRPPMQEIFASHRGLHLGFAGELTLIAGIFGDATTPLNFGGGAAFLAQYGVSPGVDVRATAFVDATGGTFGFLPLGASLGVRFNLGSVYTMGLGFRGGVGIIAGSNGSTPGPFFGPELSLIGFRFGEQRQFSVELTQRLAFYFFSGADTAEYRQSDTDGTFENAITFTYLFLDAPQRTTSSPITSGRVPAPRTFAMDWEGR